MAGFTPFSPGTSASLALAVTTSTGNGTIPAGSGQILRILNDGTVTIFFKLGAAGVTATTTDTPILAGTSELFTIGGQVAVAAISGAGSGTLRITRGDGN